jgi:hypothetical protein
MNSNSWFIEIQAIMYKYNLGDALYWIENPMKKEQAMKVIKKEVSDYWSKYIQDMAILYQGLRDRPFNLKGGLWFFVSFRNFFSDNTRVRIFIFFVTQSANFFSRI